MTRCSVCSEPAGTCPHVWLREATTHLKRPKSRWTPCGLLAREVQIVDAAPTCPRCAPPLCLCGCGTSVRTGRQYIHGHNRRHVHPPDVEAAIQVIRLAGPDARRQAIEALSAESLSDDVRCAECGEWEIACRCH